VTPVIAEKTRACDVYRSQLANYPYTACAVGLNRYRALTVSAVAQYAEGYVLVPGRALAGRPLETLLLPQGLPAARPAAEPAPRPPARPPPLVATSARATDRPVRLREPLATVLTQTHQSLEGVVVNDGGEDVTAVIAEFAPYLDIRGTSPEGSSGRAAAANVGL